MRIYVATMLLLLVLPSGGCEPDEPIAFRPGCEALLDAVTPDRADLAGGGEASISGYWIASEESLRDTVVRVGGVDADVTGVVREGCDICTACSVEAVRCRECESVCRGTTQWVDDAGTVYERETCTEAITISVPPGEAPGEVEISVTTRHGEASNLWFTYLGGDDDDSADDD